MGLVGQCGNTVPFFNTDDCPSTLEMLVHADWCFILITAHYTRQHALSLENASKSTCMLSMALCYRQGGTVAKLIYYSTVAGLALKILLFLAKCLYYKML